MQKEKQEKGIGWQWRPKEGVGARCAEVQKLI